MILHLLQQDLDGLLAVVALVLRPIQVVGLVDEQHAAHRPLQHFTRLWCGVADVLTDQIVARHRDHVAFAHIAEAMQDLSHAQRDGRLAGAGVAREVHVQGQSFRAEARLTTQRVDQQQRADVTNATLHWRETDQLGVELVEHVGHMRVAERGFEIETSAEVVISHRLFEHRVHETNIPRSRRAGFTSLSTSPIGQESVAMPFRPPRRIGTQSSSAPCGQAPLRAAVRNRAPPPAARR